VADGDRELEHTRDAADASGHDDLIRERDQARERVRELEAENASLREQVRVPVPRIASPFAVDPRTRGRVRRCGPLTPARRHAPWRRSGIRCSLAPTMDETAVVEKLRLIEEDYARPASGTGAHAAERIRAHLQQRRAAEPDVEVQLTVSDEWAQQLFASLCRRYGLRPYRRRGQRRTTAMVQAPASFIRQILWPEFEALQHELRSFVRAATSRVICEAIHADGGEPPERDEAEGSG
jgi:hypothetical protein